MLEAAPTAPVVIIADCPTISHLPSLLSAPAWTPLAAPTPSTSTPSSATTAGSSAGREHVNCIVHLTPPQVRYSSLLACLLACLLLACLLACLLAALCSRRKCLVDGRSQESQAMADRITDEVNGILCQEAGAPSLSKQAVLDLIDQGASQGGPQVGPAIPLSPCHHPSCYPLGV